MIKKLEVQNENEQYIIPIQEQIINKSKVKKKIIYIYIYIFLVANREREGVWVLSRAIHESVWVGFMPNPEPTQWSWVVENLTCHQPLK